MNKPTVSVIIPSYNYGTFLEEAILSVLNQTKIPDEILIIDDCSMDQTQQVGEKFEKQYSNLIKYYRNKKNLGIVKNFNQAVSLTKGDYICFIGADNTIPINYIEACYKTLLEEDHIGIAYTDFILFGERALEVYKGFKKSYQAGALLEEKYAIKFPEFDIKLLAEGNFIHGSSMYKRCAYDLVGGYQSKNDTAEDYNLFSRIVRNGFVAKKVHATYLNYRQHSEEQANIKLINRVKLKNLENENEILKNYVDKKEHEIQEFKDILTNRDHDIEKLNDRIKFNSKNEEELQKIITHRDQDVAELQATIRHWEKDIMKLNETINSYQRELECIIQERIQKEKMDKQNEEKIDQQDKELDDLKNKINQIESTWWFKISRYFDKNRGER